MKSKRKTYPRLLLLIIPILAAVLIMQGCTSEAKEEAKSMDQIRQEEGVPVKYKTVENTSFNKDLTFFAKLSGIKESTKYSMTADKVKKLNVRVGSSVKEGEIVLVFPNDNPAIQYDQAKLAFENAEKNFKRMQELVKAGETAQMNFDNTQTQYLVSKRNWEAVKQIVNVEAPISGVITELFVKEGDDIAMGKQMFTVSQLGKMKAKVWASEDEVRYIKNGMDAFIEYHGKEYKGRVTEVALAMDNKASAFGVEIEFPNGSRELMSGTTVDVKISIYQNDEAIVVPRSLTRPDGDKLYVYLENEGTAEKRYISVGAESNIDYEVTGGLEPGDKIITEGISLLSDGVKIKVVND